MKQTLIFTKNIEHDLAMAISECARDKVFVLADTETKHHCWGRLKDFLCLKNAKLITVEPGENNKNLTTATAVWEALSANGASRYSLLINIGGGMVTDLGGFVASTFKRGINFINIPTTLLAMVDASVGGKTGVNLGDLKNEIGSFAEAKAVIVDTAMLHSLSSEQILSGYAEMIKHSLLDNESHWADIMNFNMPEFLAMIKNDCPSSEGGKQSEGEMIRKLIDRSVKVKQRFVAIDPHEKGMRKGLNLGHTIGHAIESWSNTAGKALPHGYAVAYGLVCALYISCVEKGFSKSQMRLSVQLITSLYGHPDIVCDDYKELIRLMKHDKKNKDSNIRFTLLSAIGTPCVDNIIGEKLIEEALDFLREG